MILIPCLYSIYIVIILLLLFNVAAELPPRDLLDDVRESFTLNGTIPFERFYVDDTQSGNKTHFIYSYENIKSYLDGASKISSKIKSFVERNLGSFENDMEASRIIINRLTSSNIIPKDQWMNAAIFLYQSYFKNSKVCIFGSMDPWLEAAVIAAGADQVVTLEYNKLTYSHERIRTINENSFESFYSNSEELGSFDIALSASSFDHDGLGRYGDPIDPNGDLKAMNKTKSLLKPGGYLFLSVPIGPDVIVFNLHRRYGIIRLPLLLEGWEIVERIAWDEERLVTPADWRRTYEPIHILQKPLDSCISSSVIE